MTPQPTPPADARSQRTGPSRSPDRLSVRAPSASVGGDNEGHTVRRPAVPGPVGDRSIVPARTESGRARVEDDHARRTERHPGQLLYHDW
ncbi:hypothetical protein [Halostagnicola kamekurae]|uniref:hypothetical protein n=1 Tax=Halostagnicola kamekurae TaxID=619731 RepID=UPI000B8375D4|nr:hypothetical protein [Halostagnicola kamekurae]